MLLLNPFGMEILIMYASLTLVDSVSVYHQTLQNLQYFDCFAINTVVIFECNFLKVLLS